MQKRTVNESISTYSNKFRTLIKNESTFTDNIGNYAITNCFGSIENTLENAKVLLISRCFQFCLS